MSELQKELIKKLVYIYSKYLNIYDTSIIENKIHYLTNINIDDAIDDILISLNYCLQKGIISEEDSLSNVDTILQLNPEKYKTIDDLLSRLNWLKEMNITEANMPLSENHRLILEVFDKFNSLIKDKFDCYYTGGIMGYLATNQSLKRYHSDLDLLINENQLGILKGIIDSSDEFEFIDEMESKDKTGHEYIITYKDTPIHIGLFLFERKKDGSIIDKNYYYEYKDSVKELYVDEHHNSLEFTKLLLDDHIKTHNGLSYKMVSLESIYNSKKASRPKDKYDARIIESNIDQQKEKQLGIEKTKTVHTYHKLLKSSIIENIEEPKNLN